MEVGGFAPPPFARVSGAPGAAQTSKMTDFRPFKKIKFLPKVQPRRDPEQAATRAHVDHDNAQIATCTGAGHRIRRTRPGT